MRRKIVRMLITISLTTVLAGANVYAELPEWTIMLYIAGGLNLSQGYRNSLMEIKGVDSNKKWTIIAQFDTGSDDTPTLRYELTPLEGATNISNRIAAINNDSLKGLIEAFKKISKLKANDSQALIKQETDNLLQSRIKVDNQVDKSDEELGPFLMTEVLKTEKSRDCFYRLLGLNQNGSSRTQKIRNKDFQQYRNSLAIDPTLLKAYLIECLLEEDSILRVGKTDTGNPKRLLAFLKDGVDQYPAHHRMVIICGHSIEFSTAVDPKTAKKIPEQKNRSPFNPLTVGKIANVIQELTNPDSLISPYKDQKKMIDILGFDTCVMGLVEVFYHLKDSAGIGIAAEGFTPDEQSWPFQKILSNLNQTPTIGPQELSKMIVREYLDSHKGIKDTDIQLAAYNISQVAEVTDALKNLIQYLNKLITIPSMGLPIVHARQTSQDFDPYFVDIFNFCEKLMDLLPSNSPIQGKSTGELCEKVKDSIENKMVIKTDFVPNKKADNSHGLSIYFPDQCIMKDLRKYSFRLEIKDLGWTQFLSMYATVKKKGGC